MVTEAGHSEHCQTTSTKITAAKEIHEAETAGTLIGSNQYELMLSQLTTHQRQLS